MRPRARVRMLRLGRGRRRWRWRRRRPSTDAGRALHGRRRRWRGRSAHGADGYGGVDGDRDGRRAVGRRRRRDRRRRRVGYVGCWDVRHRQEGGVVDRVASGAEDRRAAGHEAGDGRRHGHASVWRRGDGGRRWGRGLVAAALAGRDGDGARGVRGRIDDGSAAGHRIRDRAGRQRGVRGSSDRPAGAGRLRRARAVAPRMGLAVRFGAGRGRGALALGRRRRSAVALRRGRRGAVALRGRRSTVALRGGRSGAMALRRRRSAGALRGCRGTVTLRGGSRRTVTLRGRRRSAVALGGRRRRNTLGRSRLTGALSVAIRVTFSIPWRGRMIIVPSKCRNCGQDGQQKSGHPHLRIL